MSEPIKVMIVDDHALFRRGLQMVLEAEADIEVVAESGDGADAVEKAKQTNPDVILMDVRMPKRTGLEATASIKQILPESKILMLTVSDEEADLYEALKAGALGYLLKDLAIEEVAAAIRSVNAGHSLITPSMATKLLAEFSALSAKSGDPKRPQATLTEREIDVLNLAAQGLGNRDIAKRLVISENTVKNHIRNILSKLHLHSRGEAVAFGVREKMIDLPNGPIT